MKKILCSTGIMAACMTAWLAFTEPQSAITGSVLPADGAEAVWAVSATDSAKGVVINTGSFSLAVKPGVYKVIVKAKSPYKDVLLENQEVKDAQPLDVGQIVLEK